MTPSQRVEQDVDRPVVADVPERLDRRDRDALVRIVRAARPAREPPDGGHARGWCSACTRRQRPQSVRGARRTRRTRRSAARGLSASTAARAVAGRTAGGRARIVSESSDPGRDRDREHDETDVENERRPPSGRRRPRVDGRPSNEGSAAGEPRRHNSPNETSVAIRASRRRAEGAEGGVTVQTHGAPTERPQRGERAAEPGSAGGSRRAGRPGCG